MRICPTSIPTHLVLELAYQLSLVVINLMFGSTQSAKLPSCLLCSFCMSWPGGMCMRFLTRMQLQLPPPMHLS
jgi:hypothetical protein